VKCLIRSHYPGHALMVSFLLGIWLQQQSVLSLLQPAVSLLQNATFNVKSILGSTRTGPFYRPLEIDEFRFTNPFHARFFENLSQLEATGGPSAFDPEPWSVCFELNGLFAELL
jgi:hypothetical protein